MSDVLEFATRFLEVLSRVLMQPPFLWFWGILLMLVVFKIFKSLAHF